MPQTEFRKTNEHIVRRALPSFLVYLLVILLTPSIWGADKGKDEQTLKNAADVLQEMVNSHDIPPGLLANAQCVIVLPNVKKFGVGIGGSGGRGAMPWFRCSTARPASTATEKSRLAGKEGDVRVGFAA